VSETTSATGGYLLSVPQRPRPNSDDVERVLQQMVTALTGLPGDLVRPRWQPHPPAQPPVEVNWCALGVTQVEMDDYPQIVHQSPGTLPGAIGQDFMTRHGTVTLAVSFYGPDAEDYAGELRDSLYIPQNWEPLGVIGAKLYEVQDMTRNPELINNQWVDRADLNILLRRVTERRFAVFDLIGASVRLLCGQCVHDITVTSDTSEG